MRRPVPGGATPPAAEGWRPPAADLAGGDLVAEGIVVRFGGVIAVSDVTVAVPAGGFVGLIGPNGAGKTTLFNAISGFLTPASGRIRYGGRDITRAPAAERARLGIGRTFQKLELFGRMSVFDNLLVAVETRHDGLGLVADLLHLPQRHREERRAAVVVDQMLDTLGLEGLRDRRAADLPVGTARILELGRALCAGPKLLLLDEPSSGLDPDETRAFGRLLERINTEHGIGILLVEHDMDLVMEVCRDIVVLDFGRLIGHGPPAAIAADPAVRAAYLGEEDGATVRAARSGEEDGASAAPAPRG